MNAKKELLNHIKDREVKCIYIYIKYVYDYDEDTYKEIQQTIKGTLDEVIDQLDFDYEDGFGSQELFGNIWYTDGTWSSRSEYDGSECWTYNKCPEIPQ